VSISIHCPSPRRPSSAVASSSMANQSFSSSAIWMGKRPVEEWGGGDEAVSGSVWRSQRCAIEVAAAGNCGS
jgi:hypothetical protein